LSAHPYILANPHAYFIPNTAVRQALIFTISHQPFYDAFASTRESIRHDIVKTSASVLTRRSSATATFKTDLHARGSTLHRRKGHTERAQRPLDHATSHPITYITIPQTLPKPSAQDRTARPPHAQTRRSVRRLSPRSCFPHNSSWRSADPAWQGRRGLMYCLLCRKADKMCGLARIRYISHVP
jgi:hypothetical protein